MIRSTLIVLLCAVTLAACEIDGAVTKRAPIQLTKSQTDAVESAVAYKLRNPSSAQFRDFRAARVTLEGGRETVYVCGQVNGTNAFGGYTGFTPFQGELAREGFVKVTIAPADNYGFGAASLNASCNRRLGDG